MRILLALLVGFIVIGAPQALADHGLQVENPYAFATSKTQKNGAVFMTLVNHSDQDVALVGATIEDISERTEIHSMEMQDDMMMMREIEKLYIPAGESISLNPMGNHIMLMGLKAPLEVDNEFTLGLVLDNGETVQTTVSVTKPGIVPEQGHHECDCDEKEKAEEKANVEEEEEDGY